MTIDEAIKHSEDVAERYEKMEDSHDEKLKEECLQCAADHRQLAEWLRELKERRAADVQPIKCGHWYHNTSKYVSELDAYFIQACCSCCGRYSDRIDRYSQIMSNETCSHCGADMRGDENG